MTINPELFTPSRDKDGNPITLTWDQIYAVQRAFAIWQQVVAEEQKDRPEEQRQSVMTNSANWMKSTLLGRLLTTGKPPLVEPPPTAYAACWYSLIENGRADLGSHDVYGPSRYEWEELENKFVANIAGCLWPVARQEGDDWILNNPRSHEEWRLRHRTAEDPQVVAGRQAVDRGNPHGRWEDFYYGPSDWVLERL